MARPQDELEQLRRVARAAALSLYSQGHNIPDNPIAILNEAIYAAIEDMNLLRAAWQYDAVDAGEHGADAIFRITERFKNRLLLATQLAKLPAVSFKNVESEVAP